MEGNEHPPPAGVGVAGSARPTYAYWLNYSAGRVKGSISRFREGTLTLDPDGVHIDGRAVLPTGQQALILVASVFVCVGILLAAILLEHVIRVPLRQSLRWSDITDVVLERAKSRVCLVFRSDAAGKRFESLPFKLSPEQWAHFGDVARYFAPGKVREGRIGSQTSWVALAIVIGVIVAAFIFIAWASAQG